MILPGSASRSGSSSVACVAASSRSALAESSGPNTIVCKHVINVSRPNTVMNHGAPAAGSAPTAKSSSSIRNAARSDTERSHVRVRSFHDDSRRGAARFQAVSDRFARSRSASSRMRNAAGASGDWPSSSDCNATVTSQLCRGSSATSNRTRPPSTANDCVTCNKHLAGNPPSTNWRVSPVTVGGAPSASTSEPSNSAKLGSALLTSKMSAKSTATSSATSNSSRRRPWFTTVIRSPIPPPTNRSRSIDSWLGPIESTTALRRTKVAMCGTGCACESGSGRAPATVSTQRERKRVSAAKKPAALGVPSTSPRSSHTQNIEPSRTVKVNSRCRARARSPGRRAGPCRAARRRRGCSPVRV